MIELRPFSKLGSADHGWLKARHHFSFGSHYDPGNMGHGSLRVWNDDEIAPNTGFPPHPHANMEIITYVREGAITHQDSLGNKGRTEAGDVQVMSAGSGVRHSEYNLEPTKTKIFQIWIEPTTQGGQPTWGAKPFPKSDRSGNLVTIASGFADDKDALPIRADARVLATTLKAGESRGIRDRQDPQPLSGACGRRGRDQRRACQRPRRRRDPRRNPAQDHRAGRLRTGAGRRGVTANLSLVPSKSSKRRWPEQIRP
jgi:redox-sensitive bicupin YhaK (pirin superfamily)